MFLLLFATAGEIFSQPTAAGLHASVEPVDFPALLTKTNHVHLSDQIYFLTEPWIVDSRNTSLVIEAEKNSHPVLSGGVLLTNWQSVTKKIAGLPTAAKSQIWQASIPKRNGKSIKVRELWINGQKAICAQNPNSESFSHLVAWNKTNQTAAIPATILAGVRQPKQLEMVIAQVWEIAILRVKSIRNDDTNALLTFKQPESEIEFRHPWPPVIVKSNYAAPFYLANAIEFLDSPGEWFADEKAGKIYYWPRACEDMTKTEAIVPILENLIRIEGTLEYPVPNIQFKGITFSHTTWLRPSEEGHVPLQAGMFMLDAKKLSPKGTPYHKGLDNVAWIGRPPAAVTVKNANHISFENCAFEHLASAGLDFESGTHDNLVQGCIFRDIGGNGIQLGKFSDTNVETHIPCQPSDEREICSHETIANNLFTDCANQDWGCVGIAAGYVRETTIAHNEVSHLPYSGISIGWGWTKTTNAMRDNLILANRIHHVGQRLGDLGGIYTLSAQPGTVVAENFVSDTADNPLMPEPEHWFYLYLDEGSSGITVRDNWCPSEKFLKNANGPGNVWTNNGPQVSEQIKSAAGLEPAYQHLLK